MIKGYIYTVLAGFMIFVAGTFQAVIAEEVQIHGFISQGYLKTDHNNYLAKTDDGSFQFNEMGINFTTFATERLQIGCQFFARDLGDVGNDEIVVNWAFAEYNYRNWLGFRAGILKTNFGLYNDTRDYDSLRTPIFLPTSNYHELLRDTLNTVKGIQIFGTIPLGLAGSLNYLALTAGNQADLKSGSVKFLKSATGLSEISNMTAGERIYGADFQWLTPLDGLRWGMTYGRFSYGYDALLPTPMGDIPVSYEAHKAEYIVFYGEYIWKNLVLSAETYRAKMDSDVYLQNSDTLLQSVDVDTRKSYYIKLSYRITDWFETGYYFSRFQLNPNSTDDKEKLKEHCLSFRFDINPNWLFKLEAHLMKGEFGVYPDNDGHIYNEWMLYAAKISFMF